MVVKKAFVVVVLLIILSLWPAWFVDAFSEQRKYVGQEYDTQTGLDYLNARYYDAKRGQFTSPDLVARDNPEKFLADPQQLNSYSYARNNPINSSDPSGLIVTTVSGTTIFGKSDYLKDSTVLQNNIINNFKGQDIYNFSWSGKDNDIARQGAAKQFSSYIGGIMASKPIGEPLNIVCHSHGCNVAALYTQQSDSHQITNLISFGQPVRSEYIDNESKIDNHINVYSNNDMIQWALGGHQTSISAIVGGVTGLFLGPWGAGAAFLLGQVMDVGDIGFAGRTVPGANNIDVTNQTSWWHPIRSHFDLLGKQNIWDSINGKVK